MTSSPRSPARVALLVALGMMASTRSSLAQERHIEAAAKDALKRARADFSAADFDGGLARLLKAGRACGTIRCSAPTRAALSRDEGVMQLRRGDPRKAAALFLEAVRIDPKIELPKPYDASDVRAAWDAATGQGTAAGESQPATSQPTGDFTHVPVAAQAVSTPIPLYVEYSGAEHVASVVVKYRSPGSDEWKRVSLHRAGSGWVGEIPCGDVKLGTLTYYVQGFDDAGSPNALSGDPKNPFRTSVRVSITGVPPSLPGHSPPTTCTDGEAVSERVSAAACIDDSQCNGGDCDGGHCVARAPSAETSQGYARVWIGVSGSLDVVPLKSADDVCAVTSSGAPYNSAGYTCTNPNGSDFPKSAAENDTLTRGNAGHVNGGPAEGDVRLLVSLDYAFNPNLLAGVRVGAVVNTGAGDAAFPSRALKLPFHGELRGTYLFGDRPLSHSGFAPMVLLDAGIARFEAGRTVTVTQTGIAGPLEKNAWHTGGPWFAGIGGGVRYAFSQRIAFTAAAKLAHAFGGSALWTIGPEVGLAYGF